MARLSLVDVLRPHLFLGMDLGDRVGEILGALHVDEYETTWDDSGVSVLGVARIDSTDSTSPVFSLQAGGGTGAEDNGIEWHDLAVRFRLTSARLPAAALERAQVTDAEVGAVLDGLGAATGTAASDYPNTQFRLELMFELVDIPLGDLIGAKLEGYTLVPDPDNQRVKLTLPRVLLILTQDSASTTDLDLDLGSFGAESLDDADPAIASLIAMKPPYALFQGEQFGFGLQKVVLDLSAERTPPDILDRFGVGEDWRGLYVPEARFFASTQRAAGVAFNVGAKEMLIGFAPTGGIWGDFNFDVDLLGDRLAVGIRLYSPSGARVEDIELVASDEAQGSDRYRVTVPSSAGPETENYVLFVDINSGAAPFVITFVGGQEHPTDLTTVPDDAFFESSTNSPADISALQRTRLFSHDQRVAIRITSRNPRQRRVIVLDVYPDLEARDSTTEPPPTLPEATLTPRVPGRTSSVRLGHAASEEVTLSLSPASGELRVDGATVATSHGTARVRVAADSEHEVLATFNLAGEEELNRVTTRFEYDRPWGGDTGVTQTVGDLSAFVAAYNDLPAEGRIVRVDGYASREPGGAYTAHNLQLSENRAHHLADALVAAGIDRAVIQIGGFGNNLHPGTGSPLLEGQVPNDHSAEDEYDGGNNPNYVPEDFRVAVASLLRPTASTDRYEGTLARPPLEERRPDRGDTEISAPQGQQPSWLRHIGGTVRFERDAIPVAGELRLTVDFQTAHENALQEFREDLSVVGPSMERPDEQARLPQGEPNPDDGVVEFRLAITYDPATRAFTEALVARAADTDRDGLWSWGEIPAADTEGEPESNGWRDVLGLYFTLAPLLGSAAREAADGGEVVPLVIGLAAPIAITALGVAHVLRFTHYGVELLTRHDEDEFHASLMFDVESALWLNLKIGDFEIVTSLPDKPIKVRYKAIGFELDVPPSGPTRFLPVFDSSRGYTIDLADSGSLRILPALGDAIGDIIQVLGARIARTNPLNIEVELGLGVDLGVFSVDRFGFRLPVDPLGTPSITSIGVGVNIPNVLKGSGYLEIKSDGFAGQLDLTLPSVGMRIAGGLAVRTVSEGARSATGVLVTLALELPTGIPLGGTGLAIFGFLGIFAMHHRRLEDAGERNPALAWLANVARGDPTDIRAWGPALDQWAFGVGLVAGTIEGGTVLNLKGMLVLELPGPRVLLLVKANVLSPKPETKGTATGTLFAVVDVSPQRVLIGLQFEYHIESVLDLMIPIEAGFFYDPPAFPPEHFYIDVGTIARPVTAKILELFDATAYLMVHGDGIPDFPLGPLGGFSLAMGFHVSFTWGNTRIGLYLRVAAGFDAGIGFAPLFFAGRVYLEGELRLFIIGLSVRGELTFLSDGKDTRLEGRICGKIDLFFFSIEGCVGFAIGDLPGAPYAPPAIRDLKLQSRSPALVLGTGVDRGIDTVLCSGTTDGSVPKVEVRNGDNVTLEEVFVPIDSIPLIQFEVAPELAASATIDGQLSSGLPPGFGSGWQKRGPSFLRYHISSISLELVAINGGAVPSGMTATTEGPRPYTWRHPAQQASSDGLPVELALLDWKPTDVDKVMVEGPALDGTVDDRLGEICEPIAEPARVLWTFRKSRLGPSSAGFKLTGDPWPDAEDARRSQPVPTSLHVEERWRTGTFLDGLCPTLPAEVVGAKVACPKINRPERELSPSLVLADRLRLTASSPSLRDHATRATALGIPARELATSPTRPIAPAASKCVAKVLAAPFELPGEFFPRGMDDALRKILIELDRRRGDELRNVVRLTGGPFTELTLLIFARVKMVDAGFFKVRAFATDNAAVGASVEFKHISASSELPSTWRALTGPWWDDVALARSYLGEGIEKNSFGEYLVRIKLEAPASMIDVGISPLDASWLEHGMAPPSWLLASVEGLSLQEVMRATDDAREAEDDARGIEDALGDARHALLRPNAEYRVSVAYSAEVGRKPLDSADPEEIEVIRTEESTVASRTFFTDAEPPRSLEPWMLAQFPSPAEGYHFTDDPVVIVFGTDDVLELFGAYDRELRAVARAASFRGSAGTPDAERTHIMLRELFERLGGLVLSPWEATVRRLLGGRPCGDFNPEAARHGRVSLPFMLDPLTDYVVDLEALDSTGAVVKPSPREQDVGERPLYRHSFTTSRYRSRAEMAEAVRLALPSARLLTNPAAVLGLAEKLSDEAFDLALHEAGLEVAPRPEEPRVSVLFGDGTPASPLAVLLETPEPLWRSRLEPTAEHDESGEHIERWVLEKKPWLIVDELVPESETPIGDGGGFVCGGTGVCDTVVMSIAELRDYNLGLLFPAPSTPPVLPNARMEKIIHDESGTRTLVVLRGEARNTRLSLGLVRLLHPLLDADTSDTPEVLLDLEITAPAWEER